MSETEAAAAETSNANVAKSYLAKLNVPSILRRIAHGMLAESARDGRQVSAEITELEPTPESELETELESELESELEPALSAMVTDTD